jgi:hypothetical protein
MLRRSLHNGYLQLLVLTGALAITVCVWLFFAHIALGWQYIVAAVLLMACWTIRTVRSDRSWLVVLITLLAATLDAATFLPIHIQFGGTLTIAGFPLPFAFNPLFGLIFLISLWVWRDRLSGSLRRWLKGPPPSQEEAEQARRTSIDRYKQRLSQSGSEDLRRRLCEPDGFVPSARIAAEELLAERGD